MKNCKNCGSICNGDMNFCPNCGISVVTFNDENVRTFYSISNTPIRRNKHVKGRSVLAAAIVLVLAVAVMTFMNALQNREQTARKNENNETKVAAVSQIAEVELRTPNALDEAASKEAHGDLAGAIAVLRNADAETAQGAAFIEMQNRLEDVIGARQKKEMRG